MEIRTLSNYSFGGETKLSFDEAVNKVTESMNEQRFGILTEIDAKKVLKENSGLIENHITSLARVTHSLLITQLIWNRK